MVNVHPQPLYFTTAIWSTVFPKGHSVAAHTVDTGSSSPLQRRVIGPQSISPKASSEPPCEVSRPALRVGFAVSRVRIVGSILKAERAPKQALASVAWGAWHCFAQHFENAAQRNAKPPGRRILQPVLVHFLISSPIPKSQPDLQQTRL